MIPEFPQRGELWWIDLGIPKGHEQGGKRPALVLSVDLFNRGPADMVVILPLTTRSKPIRSHIPVSPPEAGLSEVSYIKCEDIRSVSKQRLSKKIGALSPGTLRSVETRVRFLLGL